MQTHQFLSEHESYFLSVMHMIGVCVCKFFFQYFEKLFWIKQKQTKKPHIPQKDNTQADKSLQSFWWSSLLLIYYVVAPKNLIPGSGQTTGQAMLHWALKFK